MNAHTSINPGPQMMLFTKRRLMIVLKWRIQNSWRLESAELRKFFFFLISQTTWKTQLVNCNRTMLASTEHSVELVFIFQDMFFRQVEEQIAQILFWYKVFFGFFCVMFNSFWNFSLGTFTVLIFATQHAVVASRSHSCSIWMTSTLGK